jgi:hypothetical protein
MKPAPVVEVTALEAKPLMDLCGLVNVDSKAFCLVAENTGERGISKGCEIAAKYAATIHW